MDASRVRERAREFPRQPGVYQFLGENGRVLYVGKAVELRGRVRSYTDPRSERIRQMVERAVDIEIAVTDTESQALLLEANLIKRHRPRYNVRLKDDKSYPLVELTDHPVPQIRITRDPETGSTVFGPYTNKRDLEAVVKAAREVYGLRGCSDHKYAGRDRPCLDYDIGLCTAPCTGEISEESYGEDVEAVERFFGGETGILAEPLRQEMDAAAQEGAFERAANLRDSIAAVERLHERSDSAVSSPEQSTQRTDVVGISLAGSEPTVALLRAERGQLVDREQHTLAAPDGTTDAGDVLGAFLPQYYAERDLPDVILCPEQPVGEGLDSWFDSAGVELRVPAAGREATLVELALKNASRVERTRDPVAELGRALNMSAPRRIEGFDVSHSQGKAVVGSNVTFVGGEPEKSDYRRKKLTETNDDYANMNQLVRWRAERAIAGRDDRPDPDLLLIDGGEGQLNAARDALSETGWDVPVIALAKAEERVITPERTYDWGTDTPQLQLLQRVRDEAHRFAVQYHETLRDDVSTPLDTIEGVGPQTRSRLLRRFGSVDGVKSASQAELTAVSGIGETTAQRIRERLS